MNEKRLHPRRRVIKSGKVLFHDGFSTFDCVIRDVSDAGAKLKAETPQFIPDEIELLVDQQELIYPCAVLWRRGSELGVRFTGAPRRVERG